MVMNERGTRRRLPLYAPHPAESRGVANIAPPRSVSEASRHTSDRLGTARSGVAGIGNVSDRVVSSPAREGSAGWFPAARDCGRRATGVGGGGGTVSDRL